MRLAIRLLTTTALCIGYLTVAPQAYASVVVAGTRVVYNQSDSEVTVKLTNNGKLPGLTKVWLDKGDPDAKPDSIDVPFTITPPIMRIDPGKSQTLRIMSTGEALPADKESILYLNVLEVPPKPSGDEASANQLQLAFRTRIKFFFRPTGLKGQASDAPGAVVWHVKRDGSTNAIEASNSSQYHVSFDRIELTGTGIPRHSIKVEWSGRENQSRFRSRVKCLHPAERSNTPPLMTTVAPSLAKRLWLPD